MSRIADQERQEAQLPMPMLPPYEIVWRPDFRRRKAGWWSVHWAHPLPQSMNWRVDDSGYSRSRRQAEREVRKLVKRINRGLAREDWP